MAAINPREYYARYSRYYRLIRDVYQKRPEVRASAELLLTLLSISFFLVFALRPTLSTVAGLLNDIKTGREVQEKLETKARALETAQLVWSEEQSRLAFLDQSLPEKPSPEHYLWQIEGLAAAEGIILSAVNFEEAILVGKPATTKEAADVPGGSQTQKATIIVAGDYSSLISFLQDLETLRQIFKIDSVNFLANPTAPGGLLLTISGRLPYFPKGS